MWWHLRFSFVIVIALGAYANVTSSVGNGPFCVIPHETERGRCVEVGQCGAYLKARNASTLSSERVNFLKKVQCQQTTTDSRPFVCCPAKGALYRNPVVDFSKWQYRSSRNVSGGLKKKKKTKRLIQIVPPDEGFNLHNECGKQVTNRIYGGEIAELDEYPWLALLVYNTNEYGCSGALIDDRHVLTAAHCVNGDSIRKRRGLKYVRLGEFNVKTEPDCIEEIDYLSCADAALNIEPQHIYVHPEYSEYDFNRYNDIAIIRLKHPVSFTHFVMPICLPNRSEDVHRNLKPGQMFSVSGWGRTDLFNKFFVNIFSPIKLKLRIPLVPKENCTDMLRLYGIKVGPTQLCAGGEYAKDTCAGDSGGPLMFFDRKHSRWVAYGIVSYGFTHCGMAGHPAVYTNVAEYIDWIQSIVTDKDDIEEDDEKDKKMN